MFVNEQYFAWQLKPLCSPITAFREYVFRDVLPNFSNINERAEAMRVEYFIRVRTRTAHDESIHSVDIAEEAAEHAYGWYSMMSSLGQSMRNLLAVGLFHLVEQQLATVSSDGVFRKKTLKNSGLLDVAKWYQDNFGVDMKTLPTWSHINELRLVANTIKHGDGDSATKLRALRPDLFIDQELERLTQEHAFGPPMELRLTAPLSGEEFFVTEKALQEYAAHAEIFFQELSAALEKVQ